jgi:hypothetical protein
VRDLPRPEASAAPPAPTTTPSVPGAEDRSTSFRPVAGGNELQSGEKLLVEAYAAIWIILLAMVLFSWRRQRGMDDRMNMLDAAIAKARADRDGDEKRVKQGSA